MDNVQFAYLTYRSWSGIEERVSKDPENMESMACTGLIKPQESSILYTHAFT